MEMTVVVVVVVTIHRRSVSLSVSPLQSYTSCSPQHLPSFGLVVSVMDLKKKKITSRIMTKMKVEHHSGVPIQSLVSELFALLMTERGDNFPQARDRTEERRGVDEVGVSGKKKKKRKLMMMTSATTTQQNGKRSTCSNVGILPCTSSHI